MCQAKREAAAVFGRAAVAFVIANQGQAEQDLLSHAAAVHTAIAALRERLQDIRAAVQYGQTLPEHVRNGLLFLWLGLGRKHNTIRKLGFYEH